jgi:hypothetical protein
VRLALSINILELISVERSVYKEASPEILLLISFERPVDKETNPD